MSRQHYIRLQFPHHDLLLGLNLQAEISRPILAHGQKQDFFSPDLPPSRHTKRSHPCHAKQSQAPRQHLSVSCMRDPALTPNAVIMRMRARGTCERLKRGKLQIKTFLASSILGLVEKDEQ
jgi:hypothetical protein